MDEQTKRAIAESIAAQSRVENASGLVSRDPWLISLNQNGVTSEEAEIARALEASLQTGQAAF